MLPLGSPRGFFRVEKSALQVLVEPLLRLGALRELCGPGLESGELFARAFLRCEDFKLPGDFRLELCDPPLVCGKGVEF